MTNITLDAGTLMLSEEDMTATGLLIPFGVPARTNVGTVSFSAGTVAIPTDTTGMSLNVEHARENVVGGFTRVWEQAEGVMSTFKFAATAAGRAAFAAAKSGERKHLSAEVADVQIKGGQALPGAALFAAAVTKTPAIPGSTLLASAPDTVTVDGYDMPAHAESEYSTKQVSTDGRAEETTSTTVEEVEDLGGGNVRITRTITTTTEISESDDTDGTDEETPDTEGTTMNAHTPGAPKPPTAGTPVADVELGTLFASMAEVRKLARFGGDTSAASTMLAALADIKPTSRLGGDVLQPAWVGKLWQGKKYQRRWMDLFTHTYGGIQLGGRKGFKLDQGTALVKKWSGEKTELPTGSGSTSIFGSTRQSYGYAADVAREWWDLEGGEEIIAGFFEGVVDSYAEVSDLDALTSIMKFAGQGRTPTALSRLIAPEVFPVEYPDALGMLIQGIEAVQDAGDDPTSAIINPTAWKQLIHTPKDMIPEFVSFAFTTGGEGTADGKVTVRKAPESAFTGIDPLEPAVVVGAKRAIEFREQGQTPIQIDALEVAKGGVDKAIIGYVETFPVREESLVMIGEKAGA